MKTIKFISIFVIIAMGITPLMAFSTGAAIAGNKILDSQVNIQGWDFSGDYISYVNSPPSGSYPTDVVLYNWKTSTAQTIYTSSNVGSVTGIDGNYVLLQDRATPSSSKIIVHDISSGANTTIGTFNAFSGVQGMAIGDGHVVYLESIGNDYFIQVKTLTGSKIWNRNVSTDYVYGFNINHGYVMYSGPAGVNVYNTATNTFFTINQASDAFMTDLADTDGTTIIFTEVGSYPNEFTRLVTYNIASGAKNTLPVTITASQFRIDAGKIYYADGTSGHDSLYWMNIDGTGVEKISNSDVGNGLVVENGKAVIMDPVDWSILYMYDTANMGTVTPPPSTGNVIGPSGGTITQTGAKLVVPAGSLSGDVAFNVDKLTVDNPNVLSAFSILPNNIAFNPPAELTLDIPGTRAAGNELTRLENGQWVVQDSTPSSGGTSLIAKIAQTGSYAITVARNTVSQAIDTAGGVVSIPDVNLNIPANALASTATVAVQEVFVEATNIAHAVSVDLGNAVLSVPAQLSFNVPAGMDAASVQVGQLVGNSWVEVTSTVNSAGQLVADITEGGIYGLINTATSGGIIPGIPFPSGMTVLAVMFSTGLAVAVIRRRYYKR